MQLRLRRDGCAIPRSPQGPFLHGHVHVRRDASAEDTLWNIELLYIRSFQARSLVWLSAKSEMLNPLTSKLAAVNEAE